jgi:penicillin-binding protein 1A
MLGNGNPKLGRAMIVQTARNFGIHAPLPDTPSLPIGADEVYVYEHAVAYATFPNLGRAVVPHAALEVRTGSGQLVWRFDRDGPKPKQVISPEVALNMIKMMNSVVENGTGKRAQLDGIKVAGKTGTTNSWRDAWFVGYTGNFVGAVWMGNDDYSPTKRMTGGTLPAMTWHNIMAYAHQGIELRPLLGLPPPEHAPTMTDTSFKGSEEPHPALLTRKGTEALIQVEHMLDDASHALTQQSAPAAALAPALDGARTDNRTDTFANAADRAAARGE